MIEVDHGIMDSLLSEVARRVRGVQNFVLKHREVECESEAGRVSGVQLDLCNIGCILEVRW